MSSRLTWGALAVWVLCVGCQKNDNTPIAAPSSDQPGYAARYPDELAKARTRFAEDESRARSTMGKFAQFPAELDKTSWPDVLKVYEAADAAGKSQEYVERLHETDTVATFFSDEKAEINKASRCALRSRGKEIVSGRNNIKAIKPSIVVLIQNYPCRSSRSPAISAYPKAKSHGR